MPATEIVRIKTPNIKIQVDIFGLNYNAEATVDDGACDYADHQVEAGIYYYSPSDLVIDIGESVQWNNAGGNHDAVATSGPELFELDMCTGPCLIGSYTITQEGTYDYI